MNQIETPTTTAAPTPVPSPDAIKSVAFIQAMWHSSIVDQCYSGFIAHWENHGFSKNQVERFTVPGSFDIPLLAQRLAKTGRFSAVVCSGFVVDGGIYRHEFVASTVVDALMKIQLETEVPMISAVLTPHQFQEHEQHLAFFNTHFLVKGEEAARACLHILANLTQFDQVDA